MAWYQELVVYTDLSPNHNAEFLPRYSDCLEISLEWIDPEYDRHTPYFLIPSRNAHGKEYKNIDMRLTRIDGLIRGFTD